MAPAIDVAGASKSYDGRQVLAELDLRIEPGELLALLGPNGAGKTTSLEIMEGFQRPDTGRVRVLGLDPVRDRRALLPMIGVVLQAAGFDPFLTVREALVQRRRWYDDPRPVDEVLDAVALVAEADRKAGVLSGGQQRRLDLGLSLVGRPRVIFLDEPTTGFDPVSRADAWALIERLRDDGTTVLLTTHYLEEAERLADRVAILRDGRLVVCTRPADLVVSTPSLRFSVPEHGSLDDLTVTHRVEDGRVIVRAPDVASVLHEVSGWAMRHGVSLDDLQIERRTFGAAYFEAMQ
jgi:ABC-2 type transport system ATP-binding protein